MKNKSLISWIILVSLTIFYVVCKFNGVGGNLLNVISIAMAGLIVLLPLKEKVYALFFYLPLYLYIYVFSFAFYNIISISILLNFLKKNEKFNAWALIAAMALFAYELLFHVIFDYSGLTYLIKWIIAFFVSVTLITRTDNSYDKGKTVFLYSLGVSIIGIGTMIQYGTFEVDSSIRELLGGGLSTLDQNTFSFYCLLAFVSCAYFLFDNKARYESKFLRNILAKIALFVLAIISILSGALMVSKTFFIVTIIWVLIVAIVNIKSAKAMLMIGGVGVLSVLAYLVFPQVSNLVNGVLERFGSASDINEITTGRIDIFVSYIDQLAAHPVNLITGAGLFTYNSFYNIGYENYLGASMITHNIPLEIICAYGIIGFFIFLVGYSKILSKDFNYQSNKNLNRIIPLLIFIIFSQSLALLREDATFFIILFCYILMKEKKPEIEMSNNIRG